MKNSFIHGWRCWLSSLLLWALLAGCSATQETNKLIIYSPHGKELLGTCKKLFEAKHPGVTVEWLDLASQEVLDRIRSEARNPQADLWWGAPATLFTHAAEEGLLAKYRPSWAAHVTADQHDANDFWYGTFVTPEIIMYNDSLLKAAEVPQDWDDLLKPAWKHRIVCREPMASGTIRTIFSAMIDRQMQGPGGEKAGFDWLRRFDGQISEYATSSTTMYQGLSDAETPVTIWNMADVVLPVHWFFANPGGYVYPVTAGVCSAESAHVYAGSSIRPARGERIPERTCLFVGGVGLVYLPAGYYPADCPRYWLRIVAGRDSCRRGVCGHRYALYVQYPHGFDRNLRAHSAI